MAMKQVLHLSTAEDFEAPQADKDANIFNVLFSITAYLLKKVYT